MSKTYTFDVRGKPMQVTVTYIPGRMYGSEFVQQVGERVSEAASEANVLGSVLHDALSYIPLDPSALEECCSLIGSSSVVG